MPRTLSPTLTARQQIVLDAINRFHELHGYYPTVRDLMTRLSIRSTSTVHSHLQALRRKGYLVDAGGKPGAIPTTSVIPARERIEPVVLFCGTAIDKFREYRRQGCDVLAARRMALEHVEKLITGAERVPTIPEEALI